MVKKYGEIVFILGVSVLLFMLFLFVLGYAEIVKNDGKYASDCGRFAAFVINTVESNAVK